MSFLKPFPWYIQKIWSIRSSSKSTEIDGIIYTFDAVCSNVDVCRTVYIRHECVPKRTQTAEGTEGGDFREVQRLVSTDHSLNPHEIFFSPCLPVCKGIRGSRSYVFQTRIQHPGGRRNVLGDAGETDERQEDARDRRVHGLLPPLHRPRLAL